MLKRFRKTKIKSSQLVYKLKHSFLLFHLNTFSTLFLLLYTDIDFIASVVNALIFSNVSNYFLCISFKTSVSYFSHISTLGT